jgi:drug/metabolite transporter (DMT)-like permease
VSKKLDVVLFITMVSFWALNYPLVKFAFDYVGPFTLLFYRILFAIIGMLIIFRKKIQIRIGRDEFVPLLILSLLNVVIFMELWFIAEQTISSSLSAIIIYTYPVTSTLLSIVFLKERYNAFMIFGIILGFSGIIFIFFNSLFTSLGSGIIFALIGSLSWASGTIYYKKYLTGKRRETINFYQFALALLPSLLIAEISKPTLVIFEPSFMFLIIVAIIGIPGTAVAYYAFLHLNREYKVSTISSFLFLVPAISVVFSLILLDEVPTRTEFIGLILVCVGIIFSAKGTRN